MRILHLAPHPDAGSGIAAYGSRYRTALRAAGIEIVQLPAPAGVPLTVSDVRAYIGAAVRAAPGFDVVHAELGAGALRELWALRAVNVQTAVPTAATLHDPPRPSWWPFHVQGIKQRGLLASGARRASDPLALRLEHQVLVGTNALFMLTSAGLNATVGTFGSDLERRSHRLTYAISGSPEGRPRAAAHEIVLGFYGYWYPGKGLEHLIDALALLRRREVPFRGLLWGDISRLSGTWTGLRYREAIVARIRRLGLSSHVDVLGYLAEEETTRCLQRCDAIVLPYHTSAATAGLRSTSAAMFDALAAGTPVIASDVKALDETIVHGVNGLLVPPGDVGALARTLEGLQADADLRARLIDGARESALGFDASIAAKEARAVYAAIRGTEPRPDPAILRA